MQVVYLSAFVGGSYSGPRPLMSDIKDSFGMIELHYIASIDLHRKDDQLKPSLYFGIDLFNGYADESSGQVAKKLLEVRNLRISSGFGGRTGSCLRAVKFFGAISHTVSSGPEVPAKARIRRALPVSLYSRSIFCGKSERSADCIK